MRVVAFFLRPGVSRVAPNSGLSSLRPGFLRRPWGSRYDRIRPGAGALLHLFELRNRIDAGRPVARSPCLHDALVGHKFYVPSRNVSAEEGERTSYFAADRRRRASQVHGLHRSAKLNDFVELFGVSERLVDALAIRFEIGFLMNGFLGMRNLRIGSGPSLRWEQSESTECDCGGDDRFPPRGFGERCQIIPVTFRHWHCHGRRSS